MNEWNLKIAISLDEWRRILNNIFIENSFFWNLTNDMGGCRGLQHKTLLPFFQNNKWNFKFMTITKSSLECKMSKYGV
jgi:hypothetical protein